MSHARLKSHRRIPLKERLLMGYLDIRQYARNESFYGSVGVLGLGYLFAGGAVLAYHFLYVIPDVIFITMFMLALLAWLPVRHANVVKWGGLFNLLVGLCGLFFHLDFGLNAAGNHYEWIVFAALAIGGLLSICRRVFNHWVWQTHDRLVKQYGYVKRAV